MALLLSATGAVVAQDQHVTGVAGEPSDLPPYAAIEGKLMFLGGVIGSVESNPDPPKELWMNWRARGRLVTNDPRLNADGVLNQNYVGFEPGASGGSVRTGIGQFTNEGGSWNFESIAFNLPGVDYAAGGHYAWAMTGQSGYEGLSAVLFVLPTDVHEWEVRGVIAPAPLPLPPASVEAAE